MRRCNIIRRHRHAAVIVSTAVENVAGFDIGDAHQGIIGGRLNVVAIRGALGHAVEPQAGDLVRGSAIDDEWTLENDWRPFLAVIWSRREDLDVVGEIRKQDLAGWKHQHVAKKRAIRGRTRRTRNLLELVPVPLKKDGRSVAKTGAGHHQNVAVRFERRWTVRDIN